MSEITFEDFCKALAVPLRLEFNGKVLVLQIEPASAETVERFQALSAAGKHFEAFQLLQQTTVTGSNIVGASLEQVIAKIPHYMADKIITAALSNTTSPEEAEKK